MRDFGAHWVLVEPRRNPKLVKYMLHDPHFRLAYGAPDNAIFHVTADPPRAPGAPNALPKGS